MWKLLALCILSVILFNGCEAQMMTTTTTTTTPAPTNIFQNVSVVPSQIVNFRIPGGRLLGLLSLITSLSQKFGGHGGFAERCFGAARKLKLLIPFFLYKLGVITTTLGFLVLFTLKGLAIGIMLLILNAGGWLAKIGFVKGIAHGQNHGWSGGHGGGWSGNKHGPPVHIHVHKDRNDHHASNEGYISYSPPPGYGSSYDSYPEVGGASHGGSKYSGHGGGSWGGPHSYGRGPNAASSGPDYEPSASQAWADRLSKGLQATRTLAERVELIDLYKRLGFNVGDLIGGQLTRSGHALAFPKRVTPTDLQDPVNPIR